MNIQYLPLVGFTSPCSPPLFSLVSSPLLFSFLFTNVFSFTGTDSQSNMVGWFVDRVIYWFVGLSAGFHNKQLNRFPWNLDGGWVSAQNSPKKVYCSYLNKDAEKFCRAEGLGRMITDWQTTDFALQVWGFRQSVERVLGFDWRRVD